MSSSLPGADLPSESPTLSPNTVDPSASRPRRIPDLDVLRGFALCGILFVNIGPATHFQSGVLHGPPTLTDPSGWLQLLVQQRFFPVFSLLFGIGFSLLLRSAQTRMPRPRLVLLRRLLVLLPTGLLHQQLQPGEALLPYAIFGLLVLLPSSWLPRWAVALAAAALLPVSLLIAGGGLYLIPGMFLLGSALVRFGLVDRMSTATRGPVVMFALFAAASIPALAWQLTELGNSGFSLSSAIAGLTLAGTYTTGVLILLRTSLHRLLAAVFVPLGRMALTNYVVATPLMLLAGHLLDWPHSTAWNQVLPLAAVILLAQCGASTLWLRYWRQGPLEWLWRWASWLQRPALRR